MVTCVGNGQAPWHPDSRLLEKADQALMSTLHASVAKPQPHRHDVKSKSGLGGVTTRGRSFCFPTSVQRWGDEGKGPKQGKPGNVNWGTFYRAPASLACYIGKGMFTGVFAYPDFLIFEALGTLLPRYLGYDFLSLFTADYLPGLRNNHHLNFLFLLSLIKPHPGNRKTPIELSPHFLFQQNSAACQRKPDRSAPLFLPRKRPLGRTQASRELLPCPLPTNIRLFGTENSQRDTRNTEKTWRPSTKRPVKKVRTQQFLHPNPPKTHLPPTTKEPN